MANTKGTTTQQEKLRDLKQTIQGDESLISHYTHTLENLDERLKPYQQAIKSAQNSIAAIRHEFEEAPQKLIEYRRHLEKMRDKYDQLKDQIGGKTNRLQRLKSLKEKIAKLEEELAADGVSTE